MNNIYENYIDKVWAYEDTGNVEAAVILLEKMIEVSGEDDIALKIELAKMKFRNEYYKDTHTLSI